MALTDLTRISTSGIATGTSLSGAILHGDAHFRGTNAGINSAIFDSSANELNLKDNVKLTFGNAGTSDSQFYFDSNNLILQETSASGSMLLRGQNIRLQNTSQSNENYIECLGDNANRRVKIYQGTTTRFETTSTGAKVTGILTATSFSGPIVGNTNNASGISTFYDLRVSNNLTVEGTTTTLDTNLIGVDRVEVGANSNTLAGIAVTQSGSADLVRLYDGTSQVVTVDDTGNVGIGTGVPNSNLHIVSSNPTVRLQDSDNSLYSAMGGESGNLYLYTATSSRHFIFRRNSPSAEIARITGDGKLGIGTHTPDHSLHILKEAGDAVITIESTGNGNHSALEFFRTSSGGDSKGAGSIYVTGNTSTSEAKMHFGVGHNISHGQLPRMTIMGNGEVGIGTDNPTYKLHVDSGDAAIGLWKSRRSSGSYIEYAVGADGAALGYIGAGGHLIASGANSGDFVIRSQGDLLFASGGSVERLRITSTGLVKINSASPVAGTNGENALLQVKSLSQYDGLLLGHGYEYGTIGRGTSNGALIYTANASPGNLGGGEKIMHEWWSGSSGGGGPNRLMVLSSSGRLGINNNSPQEQLQIAGNITFGNRMDGTSRYIGKGTNGSGGVIGDASANANSCWIGFVSGSNTGEEDQLRFGTHKSGSSGGEKMRIDGLGRISVGKHGIGTHNDASEYIKIQSNDTSAVLSIIGSNNTHSTLALGDEDDFNRARIRADHTHDLLGFWTADAERLRITDKGVLSSFLNTSGSGNNTGNAYYHRPVLEITHNSGTPATQIKITTNIPWTGDGTHAHSVRLAGFRYGGRDTVDIQIGWHVYNNEFYNRVATSSGSYAPTITLAVESGKVVIHLTNPGYWPKFYVESLYHPYGSKEQAEGWSWSDSAISGDSGLPVNTVPYKWDAGGLSFNDSHNNNGQGDLNINDGNLIVASGHGINFGNTANGSGATGISELLDDYEFGDFTPTIHTNTNINSTSGENSSHTGAGQYTKVGKMVTVTVDFNNLHGNARDHVLRYISGLPFTSRSNNKTTAVIGYQRGLRFVYGNDVFFNQAGRYHTLYGYIGGSTTNLSLNGSMSYSPYSGWPATHNSSSSQYMRITISYFTD